jgi:hypothetical protein
MHVCRLRCASLLSIALFLSASVQIRAAATVAVVPSFPNGDVNSVFDVSHTGNSYSLGTGTVFNPGGLDVRDLFGGMFGAYAPERGRVVFLDDQAKGTVETINVTLANPVSLTNYALWISEDMGTNGSRSTREFKLFAGATLLDDVVLLDTSGSQSFTGVYGGNGLEISDSLSSAPVTANYTLEFIQNQNAGGVSGLRAEEFDAYTPEPGAISLLGIGILCIAARRRAAA